MAMVSRQIEVDEATERYATNLLDGLGLDMSDAVNLFLRQVVLHDGLPFEVKYPELKPEVIEAMEEAKRISKDPNTVRYRSFEDALKDMGI